ncbi:ABC transporter permease [Mycolicibacterium baixiangningiae]|uniref:ABC transporter permease n=1 Tax=Mycolicibacterium baixiangningiae TaxID=2761578 RepID=UPI0018682899|nr:ABC transporter permease subunit [Mycolicibacterium baixiangningiae]
MTAVTALSRPRPRRIPSLALDGHVLAVAFIVILLAVQEILTRTGVLPAGYFPPASEIAGAVVAELNGSALGSALWNTMSTWLLALCIAVVLGTVAGIVLGLLVPLEALLRPVIEFLRPVPSVALIPLVVLTIGTGSQSALFLAVFAAFWQVLVPAIAGVRAAHPVALETARSYHLTSWQKIRWIQLPSMLPYLTTAIRLATSTTLILVVTAEIIIQMPGIGYEITMSRSAGDPARMYAYIVVSGLAGIVLNGLMRRLENHVLSAQGLGVNR